MSRTPKADTSKLPLWAQELIAGYVNKIDQLELNLDEALGWCDNLENVLEDLTVKQEALKVETHETNRCAYHLPTYDCRCLRLH